MSIIPNVDRDFTEWHGGCSRALVWALDVDTPAVRGHVAEAAARLDGLLLARYARQPHVTLAYAGLVPEPGATPSEPPYGDARRRRDVAMLETSGVRPFQLSIGGWGTFPMAPYLDATAVEVARLQTVLASPTDHPHVTLGLYAVEVEMAEVEARMAGFSPPPMTLTVDEVALMSYATDDIAGPLTTVGTLSLADGAWRG